MHKIIIIVLVIIFVGLAGYFLFLNKPSQNIELSQAKATEILSLKECKPEGIPEEYKSCAMSISKNGDQWLVTVTYDGFYDDSVKAGRTEAILEYKDGQWLILNATDMYQCWPGRGHQDFSTEICV
jgi:hypothetical protein